MPSRMFWISHFVGERTSREYVCLHACESEMQNKLMVIRIHEEKGKSVLPHNNDIDCILAYTILNEYNAEAQQARFSPQFGPFSLHCSDCVGLGAHNTRKKTTTTCSESDNGDCEKKIAYTHTQTHTHTVWETYMMVRYCIRFRHSSERLGIVCDGTCGCVESERKNEKNTHIQGMKRRKGDVVSWAHAVI